VCHGTPCGLPHCTYSAAPALGAKRRVRVVRGRSPREQEYMRGHPWCEECLNEGKHTRATECHHTERRGLGGWNRDTSPLKALCNEHHRRVHG